MTRPHTPPGLNSTDETNTATEITEHIPPSLPNSPLPKRVKQNGTTSSIADTIMPPTTIETSTLLKPNTSSQTPNPPLLVKKLSADASIPTRGSAHAAGYDLYASKPTTIPARGKALVSTDLSIATPEGTYGRVAPRSGLASKHFIDTGAGVIDADYRGEVKVLLFNHSDKEFEVQKGDRVAQLVLERIYTPEVVEVADLEESVRGAGGFGSTG